MIIGLLLAIIVIGFAVLGGTQEDVGYGTWDDVGADPIETDSGYDSDPTWIEGNLIGVVIYKDLQDKALRYVQ